MSTNQISEEVKKVLHLATNGRLDEAAILARDAQAALGNRTKDLERELAIIDHDSSILSFILSIVPTSPGTKEKHLAQAKIDHSHTPPHLEPKRRVNKKQAKLFKVKVLQIADSLALKMKPVSTDAIDEELIKTGEATGDAGHRKQRIALILHYAKKWREGSPGVFEKVS